MNEMSRSWSASGSGQPPSRMRLRIGASPAGKFVGAIFISAFIVILGTVFVAVALPDVPIIPELAGWTTREDRRELLSEMPVAFRLFAIALTAAGVAGLLFTLLHLLRYGCFLAGTVVTLRRTFSTQLVDLARAYRFWFDERHQHQSEKRGMHQYHTTFIVPLLCARGQRGIVKIPLADHGRRLPPQQLEALAHAIAAGGPRPEPYAGEARNAVDALRRFSNSIPGEHFNLVARRTRRLRSDH